MSKCWENKVQITFPYITSPHYLFQTWSAHLGNSCCEKKIFCEGKRVNQSAKMSEPEKKNENILAKELSKKTEQNSNKKCWINMTS